MVLFINRFLKEEDGLSTVEIVLILAVLVGIALIFRKVIFKFIEDVLGNIWNNSKDADTDDTKDISNRILNGSNSGSN